MAKLEHTQVSVSTCVVLVFAAVLRFACEFMDFFDLGKKKSSVMRFHLSALLFFSYANWCWLAVGFEKMGLKLDFFFSTLGLYGVIGSSDRSLKIEWVDKTLWKDSEKEEKIMK